MKKKFRDFDSARAFVRSLGLKSDRQWYEYCASGNKPDDIPKSPQSMYKNKGWKGWGDWTGTGNVATKNKQFRSFTEAREFVRKLNLKGQKEWIEYCASGNKPNDITSSPYQFYKNKGWKGYGDFLGTGSIATFNREYLPFNEAREFVQKLGLQSTREWYPYCKSGEKPDDIPVNPDSTYKNKGWTTWGDFLGTGNASWSNKKFRSFQEAREFVQSLRLKNQKEWNEYCKSGNKPDDIPSAPWESYKEWSAK